MEKIKWWFLYPRFELIYLLGGTPNEHQNTLHYRNIEHIMADISKKIKQANSSPTPQTK